MTKNLEMNLINSPWPRRMLMVNTVAEPTRNREIKDLGATVNSLFQGMNLFK